MASYKGFEKTPRGAIPSTLLDTHPDGTYVALRTIYNESAIWEQESKRLIWAPDALALSWSKQGTHIAGLFGGPRGAPFQFTLFSWPEKQVLQTCPVVFPEEWGHYFDVWIAPQETFALLRWLDQSEFGFERVEITPEGPMQDRSSSYFFEGTAEVTDPVFSPNGRLWACAYKMDEVWWATDPEDPDPKQPARGGEYTIGALLVFEENKAPPRSIPLVATVPPGWLPQVLLADDALVIAEPVFLDDHRIQIQLPSGEGQIHLL